MSEPKEIARGLSEFEQGCFRVAVDAVDEGCAGSLDHVACRFFQERGLMSLTLEITPLGRAVAKELEQP